MRVAITVIIMCLLVPISGYSLSAFKFFYALETNNLEQVFSNIDVNSALSIKELSEFLQDIKEICEVRYGASISLAQLHQDILELCKQNVVNAEKFCKIEQFLDKLFAPENIRLDPICLFLRSNKKQKFFFENRNISINIILGCIEIGCGILLWITPFRTIANILISDGCRRMLNEVEIIDKARNYSHNMFQKLVDSGTILYKV